MTNLIHRAGIHEQVFADRNQRYTIAIPDGYTDEEMGPLVVVLHWGWQGEMTPFFGKDILIKLAEPALRELKAIVVAPDCLYKDWANPESESAIKELVRYLQGGYNIDANQIVIMGYSKGGQGTWYLAARNQELFSMALPMAGRPQPDSADVAWKNPLYVIHSRDDEIVPYQDAERLVRELKKKAITIEFVLLEGITHHETEKCVPSLREAIPWIRKVWERS